MNWRYQESDYEERHDDSYGFVYVVYISAKLSGMLDKIKTIKDPRKN